MRHVKFILSIVVILLVIMLVIENHGAFSTKVVFRADLFALHLESIEISLYYLLPIAFLLGVLITGLYGIKERLQLSRDIKTLRTEAREKDKELNSLRNLPLRSDDMGTSI